jgi:NTE family protein
MFAVVLSGGGNHGALQAGALEVLLQAGIKPDLWVGTSAGGINAIMMAADPTVEGARKLQELWRQARPVPSSYSGLFTVAWQFLHGRDGFFPNEPVADFMFGHIPPTTDTFGELYSKTGHRAVTVSVEYPSGKPRFFGEKPEDLLIDGMMASSAFPIFFPPWSSGEARYVDGGIYANLPVRVAVEYGADVILALEVRGSLTMIQGSGIVDVASFSISTLIQQQMIRQLEWARREGARVHHLVLDAGSVMGWDFNQADLLLEMGQTAAHTFLANHTRNFPGNTSWRWRLRRLVRRGPPIRPAWQRSKIASHEVGFPADAYFAG